MHIWLHDKIIMQLHLSPQILMVKPAKERNGFSLVQGIVLPIDGGLKKKAVILSRQYTLPEIHREPFRRGYMILHLYQQLTTGLNLPFQQCL